jgi:hypothetical protein
MEGNMPKKESGMWRNKNAPMSKNYRQGGSTYMGGGMTPAEKASIMRGGKLSGIAEIQEGLGQVRPGMKKGGGTEVGKEATSYKEYVKKMFGGGMTEPTIKKNKD